jgi:hypothetical protein
LSDETNGSPRWRWENEAEAVKLRADHESFYREFQSYRQSADRRFDRLDDEMRAIIPIPSQIKALGESLDRLTEKLENVMSGSGASRRADWQMALTVIGLVAMMVFTVARGFH